MTVKEYMKLQELSLELYDLAVIDEPYKLSVPEAERLKELVVPNGRMFGTNERHLEYIRLSVRFMQAIRDGRVLMSHWQNEGRTHAEIEILPPK